MSSDAISQWWRCAVIYEVAVISFQDSDGNGKGDLKGLISRLDHLTWLGVNAVWLTPVYPSPLLDLGPVSVVLREQIVAQQFKARLVCVGRRVYRRSSAQQVAQPVWRQRDDERMLVALNFGEEPSRVTFVDRKVKDGVDLRGNEGAVFRLSADSDLP